MRSQATRLLRFKKRNPREPSLRALQLKRRGYLYRRLAWRQDQAQNFVVTAGLSPEATRAAWDAELKLELLDVHEDVAEFYDQETLPEYRKRFAESYRRLVGVHPARRDEFRDALIRIRDGGGMPVKLLMEVLNRR